MTDTTSPRQKQDPAGVVSEWELITNKDDDWTDRMAVPGGWLYRNTLRDDAQKHNPMMVTMVFVPDPDAER